MNTKALFDCELKRGAGVLLHISSLPNTYNIGNFGASAYQFIDFLEAAGMHYWQICPLGPTGFADSPYQCFSSFALNPYFIDVKALEDLQLLDKSSLDSYSSYNTGKVDYGFLYNNFWPLIQKAFHNWKKTKKNYLNAIGFDAFFEAQKKWLPAYASFMAIKESMGGKPVASWPSEFKEYGQKTKNYVLHHKQETFELHCFVQYLAYVQWQNLKEYAHLKKIKIIGDLPIFVSADSADVWAHPAIFLLSKDLAPKKIAGVPPDYFSPTGQLWGNPLYNWDVLRQEGYGWWLDRLQGAQNMYDVIRLDHFRGFDAYWAVDANSKNATLGTWEQGPKMDFFEVVHQKLGNVPLIAEDLGIITPSVEKLLHSTGLPGMAVLQFAFGSGSDNTHLCHNHKKNQIVYTGTHDNDTAWGWYQSASMGVQRHLCQYLRVDGSAIPWDLIRSAYQSVCQIAIAPLQDFLSLGTQGRMNTPGKTQENWTWRCKEEQMQQLWKENAGYLHYLSSLYNRN